MKSNAELAGAGAADMPANGSEPGGGGGMPMEGIGAFVAPPMPANGSPDERPTAAKGSTDDAPPPNAGEVPPEEANGSLPAAAKGSSAASCAVSFATPPLLDPGGRQTASCCFGGPRAGGPRRRGAGAGGFGSFGIGTAGARAWLALVSARGSPGMAPAPKL